MCNLKKVLMIMLIHFVWSLMSGHMSDTVVSSETGDSSQLQGTRHPAVEKGTQLLNTSSSSQFSDHGKCNMNIKTLKCLCGMIGLSFCFFFLILIAI